MIRTRQPHRTQLRTISMILIFDNKFDQIDEADCMFIFQIKHQYSFWIIIHILFNALLRVLNRFSWPRSSHSVTKSGHNFERHHNNLSSVNYLMTTVKIERAFIYLRSHIHLYIIHMTLKPFLYSYHKCVSVFAFGIPWTLQWIWYITDFDILG